MRASPDTLNRIAQQFQQVQTQCQELFRSVSGIAGNLQAEWHGPGAQGFMTEFQQIQSSLFKATQRMEGMASLLQQTAARMSEADQRAAKFSAGSMVSSGPELSLSGSSSGGGAGGLELVVNGDSAPELSTASAGSVDQITARGVEVDATGANADVNLTTVAGGEQPTLLVTAEEVSGGQSGDPFLAYEQPKTNNAGAFASTVTPESLSAQAPSFGSADASSAEMLAGSESLADRIVPLAQGDYDNCGRTSVAMAINALTGREFDDWDIQEGGSLLSELNRYTAEEGYTWTDANLDANSWSAIEQSVKEGSPVVIGLNGPEFSPSGNGHIVTIVGIDGDKVTFADPAIGEIRETTRDNILNAEQFPQGNFVMYPRRLG